ncbi:TonB-dependent receptor [Penaeicola halotolerans]|uniref:TonB-dependent receptor n=1 Tax=Penaeicola halotolerans TaxID=2793196 RepID=UPI001CF8328C|nr:TonB-dependent receptor [Penaeicola halotolerans]
MSLVSLTAQAEDIQLMILNQDSLPVPYAQVRLENGSGLVADIQGRVALPHSFKEQVVTVKAIGYTITQIRLESSPQQRIILKEDPKQLDEVVISATRTSRFIDDIPMPVTIINQEMIRQSGALRLSDVLREQASLQLTGDHGVSVQMQGLSSDYVLILLDGEPLIGRTAGTFDLERIAVANIERIEIIKGPSSSLYGSEAMAGVINIITKDQKGKQIGIQSRYRSFNTLDLGATVDLNGEKTDLSVFLNRYRTDGFDLNPSLPGQTAAAYKAYTLQTKFGYKFSDKLRFTLALRGYQERQQNELASIVNGEVIGLRTTGRQTDFNINPVVSFTPSSDLTITYRNYLTGYETLVKTWDEFDNVSSDPFNQTLNRNEIQTDWQWQKNHLSSIGIGYLSESVDALRYEGLTRFDAFYLFGQHQWTQDRSSLVLGFRWDQHSQYGQRLSPKASYQYNISKNLNYKVSIGGGFKAPDFRQLLLNFNNAAVGYYVFGNQRLQEGVEMLQDRGLISQILIDPSTFGQLEAESSLSLNTGFTWQKERFKVSTNFFYNDINNLIETLPFATLNNRQQAFTYRNVSSVFTTGLELESSYQWRAFNFNLGYMYLEAKDREVLNAVREGQYFRVNTSNYGGLFNRSRHNANLKISYLNNAHDFDISLRGLYRGRFGFADLNGNLILDMDQEYAPGLFSLNASASKTFNDNLRLEIGANNLLNQVIRQDPTNPGRLLYVGISYQLTK